MARKRYTFLRTVQSLLKLVRLKLRGGIFSSGFSLFLVGIVLTTGISPVLSQMPEVKPISKEQFKQVQELQQSGRYYQACDTLVAALKFNPSICQNQDLTEEFEGIIDRIERQPNSSQIIAIFGNILRGIGQLESSQIFLERSLAMANSPQVEGKLFLSLGNTLRAMGKQKQDQQASPVR